MERVAAMEVREAASGVGERVGERACGLGVEESGGQTKWVLY